MIIKTYTGADRTLFHIAAADMNDPLQWWRIAQANNLLDVLVTGTVTLTVPSPNPSTTGGAPQL